MIYVLRVRLGDEQAIMYALRDKGYTVYCPREEYTYRKGGKWHKDIRTLFNGYIFIDLPCVDGSNYYDIKSVSGVGHFISKTSCLSPTEAEYITGMCREDVLPISTGHIENGNLKLDTGYLKQYEHKIIKYSRRQHKAVAEITLYGEPYRITCTVDIQA